MLPAIEREDRSQRAGVHRGLAGLVDALEAERLHLLHGLEAILLDIDKAIAIIRGTKLEAEVVPNLMRGFDIDETFGKIWEILQKEGMGGAMAAMVGKVSFGLLLGIGQVLVGVVVLAILAAYEVALSRLVDAERTPELIDEVIIEEPSTPDETSVL